MVSTRLADESILDFDEFDQRDEVSLPAAPISIEEYLANYAPFHCEYMDGAVIKMSPVTERHDALMRYLENLLEAYLSLKPLGVLRREFTMRLRPSRSVRLPDLQVILNANLARLSPTYLDGPADLAIEVVSPESVARDHGDKFVEYEKGGVSEYWIVDPIHEECRFYRLERGDEDNRGYVPHYADGQGNYSTPMLPNFVLHVPTLWDATLPGYFEVAQAVKMMVTDSPSDDLEGNATNDA